MDTEVIKIFSKCLNKEMNIAIYVPKEYRNINLPVLYFLHGRSGSEEILKFFNMDTLASSLIEDGIIKPMIIVCPNMDNSRGINSSIDYKEVNGKYGTVNLGLYEDYLINEVIPYIDSN